MVFLFIFEGKRVDMRLAAVYINEHFLFSEPQTLNFGGKYIYNFKLNESKIEVSRKENQKFIKYFFGKNISLASAIVGGNGSGKTSLVHTILMNYNNQNYGIIDCNAIVFIFEDSKSVKIFEKYPGEATFSCEAINFKTSKLKKKEFATSFYTPILDVREFYSDHTISQFFDLSKFRFFQNDTESNDGSFTSLSEFHLSENLKRWIAFRGEFKSNLDFADIPKFDSIKINVNRVFSLLNNVDQISRDFRVFMKAFYRKWQEEYRNKSTNTSKIELNIVLSVIEKVFKILEGTGNTHLEEGRLNIDLKDIENLNLEESFYLFLDNHYFIVQGSQEEINEDVLLPVSEIKGLIKTLLENIPNESKIKKNHWNEYEVDFNTAAKIDVAYRNFIRAFSLKFSYDKTILLTFKPNIDLSSGEKGLLDLFSSFHSFNDEIKSKNILIFIDEGDATFHPEWKIKYVNSILKIFPEISKGKTIQIIFTTHDPLTLSDIPNSNVVYLKKEGGKTKVLSQNEKPKKSFGANITDLLADSFFINDGLIGDFAKGKIEEVIKFLKKEKSEINSKEECKKIIELIDEPLMREKLLEMYYEAFDEEKLKERELKILEELAKKHNKKITDA